MTAFPLLERHQTSSCCFNDDVQGTAAVVLGGIFAALPLTPCPKVGVVLYANISGAML